MIIDGRAIAAKRLEDLRSKIKDLKTKPKLVAVLVGDDPASEMYVGMKAKRASEVGIESETIKLPETTSQPDLISHIEKLNNDKSVTGILVQLPLPKNLDTEEVLGVIDPIKDVDGLTGKSEFLPATVKAVLSLVEEVVGVGGQVLDKTFVVVGQGKLVGKPLADYLEKTGIEVIRCDEFTKDLKSETLKGDVLVSATGVPNLIKKDMVKAGAIVIDCGAPKPEVEPDVAGIASAITPVPGGVGPMTVVSLLENTVLAVSTDIIS